MSGLEIFATIVSILLVMTIIGLMIMINIYNSSLTRENLVRTSREQSRKITSQTIEIESLTAERKILRKFVYRITNSLEKCFNKLSYDEQFGLPSSLLIEIREEVAKKQELDERIATLIAQIAYEIPHSTTVAVSFDEVYDTIIETNKKAYNRDFEGVGIEICKSEMNKLTRNCLGARIKNVPLKINGINKSVKIWV